MREREWYHSIDLGDGFVTDGKAQPNELLESPGVLPDVRSRSVLDIGAWDGKYSFEAERAGAARVVALDHYVWRLHAQERDAYYEACELKGRLPDPAVLEQGFLDPDGLPGKEGFDLAKQYLGSHVEAVAEDFMTMDLGKLGTFDVVFYLGVFYHMVNPVGALQRLHQVTGGVAVIETETIKLPPFVHQNLVAFYPGEECRSDYTNWSAPTERALHDMCLAAGFRRVQTKARDPARKSLASAFKSLSLARWREALPLLAGQWSCRVVVHTFV